jgi:glutamyl-tRNA synthetase
MIKTRFSPSPTGMIHLGNARAALFSALFAKKSNGKFLLRIEDTDAARSEEKFVEKLQDDLRWLGVHWQEGAGAGGDHGPYYQSQRHEIYDRYYKKLEEMGRAYPCFCTEQELALHRKMQLSRGHAPRYSGKCRKLSAEEIQQRIAKGDKPALRFRVPDDEKIEFTDVVKGPQHFDSYDIGDFIIRRADGSSSFMFCNAIDDSLMEVTHVIRGEDHLTNTPRQLMILQALQMRMAEYGHLSLITGDDGSPLSKRHGSSSLNDLREQGFLPHAVLNYMARLSHAYDRPELMSFDELAEHFHLEKLSRAPARFDLNQLMHWQKETVMRLSVDEVWSWLGDDLKNRVPEKSRELFADVMRKNILFPSDALKWAEVFFGGDLNLQSEQVQILQSAGEAFFAEAVKVSEQHGEDLKNSLNELKTKLNVSGKQLFMPVRVALTGEQNGPEMPQIATLLGAEKIRQRFERAYDLTRGK